MNAQPDGAMVALLPTDADAQRLAAEGGEPADQLHVTLTYLGDADSLDPAARQDLIDALNTAVNGLPAVDADVFSLAAFNPGGDAPCLVLGLTGDFLDAVHTFIGEAIPALQAEQHAPWQPHITLRYTDDLTGLAKLADRVGPVRFDRLRIAFAGQTIDIPLLDGPGEIADDGFDVWMAEADTSPGDGGAARLKQYWLAGPGLAKWTGSPHPWTALYRSLRKYIKNPSLLKQTVSRWYIDHYGHPPNRQRSPLAESAPVKVAIAETGRFTTLGSPRAGTPAA